MAKTKTYQKIQSDSADFTWAPTDRVGTSSLWQLCGTALDQVGAIACGGSTTSKEHWQQQQEQFQKCTYNNKCSNKQHSPTQQTP